MIPTPSWALGACASVAGLRQFCPGHVPLTRRRGWTMIFTSPTRRFPLALFELQSGIVWGGFQERVHRPPILGNTIVLGGQFLRLAARAFPSSRARPVVVRNGIADGLRRRPVGLGPRTWSGLRGELSLTPTIYAAQGELADLVVFRWRDAAGDHALGLNVWEPLTEAVATLRAIVSTFTAQPLPGKPQAVAAVDGVPMSTTPLWLGELCRTSSMLYPACPNRVPAAGLYGAAVDIVPTPPSERPRLTSVLVNIQYSDLRGNRPPPFVHLELTAGRVLSSKRLAPPVPIGRLTVPDGYAVTRPISLGRRDWTSRPGKLVFGDCFGNHLCYRWSQKGRDYQIDLHAWEPVAQTVRVLRAIVVSTPNVIRVASLRLSLPAGWTWAQERGGYRNCSNPVVKLWAASYRLAKGFGKHEGPLVVPPGQVLIVIGAKPVRSSSTLWRRWRVSNAKLHPAVPADGSRYKAQLTFPASPTVGATLWAGSRQLSTRMLRVTNRLLASLSVDPRYGCRT